MRFMICMLCFAAGLASGKEAAPLADDPVIERRLMELSAELRCLVCQNQSLADSHADLAVDLRNQIRNQMRAGRSDAEVKSWLTERYGDFVLYRPPVKSNTWLLWFGPFVLLVVALTGLLIYVNRRRRHAPPPPLTEAEHARAQALLGTDPTSARRPTP
ncbi:MAG: cytochrome c-type biogenesis protein CcmH [Proteobacteria bacterium]|nr:MAG: cytochrome c-type biogenesis protein CcmH [Pseudomonadota bacterium]